MIILTPQEIRTAEKKADAAGLSYAQMMENAGRGCAEHILENYPEIRSAAVICGKGKNGGDGFVIARYLNLKGVKVSVICMYDSPSDELSESNRSKLPTTVKIISYPGNELVSETVISKTDIVIDAVFGIGFRGQLPDYIKSFFAEVNSYEKPKIAIDIPSGLTLESYSFSECIRADETLSMLCMKKEHVYKPWSSVCGKVSVIPIGFTVSSDKLLKTVTCADVSGMMIKRPVDSNKGTFGKTLIAGGCYTMPGALVIAAKGAVSTGAGLTCLAFPDACYSAVTPQVKDCVLHPLRSDINGMFSADNEEFFAYNCNEYDSAAVGCGMGKDSGAEKILYALIRNYKKTLIIDADGINIISRNINILKESEADIILTPHPGEFSRLTGLSVEQVNDKREFNAKKFADEYNVTVLLKGSNTVIAAPGGKCFINPTGSSALARGGSGDLLTGIIASFAAQGMTALDACLAGAYVHGLAGEIAGRRYTEYAASADRIISSLPDALSEIIQGK